MSSPLAPGIHDTSPAAACSPTLEQQWRAIILFGRNVASYKFALAKALLETSATADTLVKLEDLAKPFALHVCEHLRLEDKQATSSSSAFLDGCRKFNAGSLDESGLVALTTAKGFANVIDAFHVVGRAETPRRFFIDERSTNRGIRITDEFGELTTQSQSKDMPLEVEARWRLVETSWRLGMSRSLVVGHDSTEGVLWMPDAGMRRKAVTSSKHALNGYQQGRCFYCSGPISLTDADLLAEVDHFFPHALKQAAFGAIIDGVWNLVLACRHCNRGVAGKSDRVPTERLLERLHTRNEFLIGSHHPLRETLIAQTGVDDARRRGFLRDIHAWATGTLIHCWDPA